MKHYLALVLLVAGCGRVAFDPRRDPAGGTDGGATGDVTGVASCGSEPTLVACFPFDGNGDDTSGRGNHSISVGTSVFTPGIRSFAAKFDATSDIRVPDMPSFDFSTGLTVMAWVRLDTLPTDARGVIIDRNMGFAMFVRATGHLGLGISTSVMNGGANASTPLPIGSWSHVAGTYDRTAVNLYVGGAQVDELAITGDLGTADTGGTRIGGNVGDTTSSNEETFFGAIDELGVWEEALSPASISAAAQIL